MLLIGPQAADHCLCKKKWPNHINCNEGGANYLLQLLAKGLQMAMPSLPDPVSMVDAVQTASFVLWRAITPSNLYELQLLDTIATHERSISDSQSGEPGTEGPCWLELTPHGHPSSLNP